MIVRIKNVKKVCYVISVMRTKLILAVSLKKVGGSGGRGEKGGSHLRGMASILRNSAVSKL